MPDRIDRMALKFRAVLAATEVVGPDELRVYQEQLLDPLLRHARRNVPYYGKRLTPVFRDDSINFSRWQELPILTRHDVQQNIENLTATRLPPHTGRSEEGETSGSTGQPLIYRKSELVDIAALALTDRLYRWWNFDGSKILATTVSPRRELAPPPDGATTRGWRTGFPDGRHHMIDTMADIDQLIGWLLKIRPHYLSTYAAMLGPLAERTEAQGVRLKLDRIISRGGILPNDARKHSRRVFGASIADQYGADEIGHIATQCRQCGEYHIAAETALLEVLDDNNNLCNPGETGRVIITAFYNYAMPLIRYEIGDYATVGSGRENCRISLPTLSRIVGRYRNVFTLKDNRILFPNVDTSRFREFITYRQIQLVQTEIDKLEVRYVPAGNDQTDECGLRDFLRNAIDPSLDVSLVAVDSIAASSVGKFEDYVSFVERKSIET